MCAARSKRAGPTIHAALLLALVLALAGEVQAEQLPIKSYSPAPATELNQFIGSQVDQSWVLTIDKDQAPGVDFTKVVDVALGVEYKADLI
jgi:hypothetical protein